MAEVTGTAANDVLVGTNKDDTLDGLTGIDRMAGGRGNDIYFVDQAGDVVTELANRGLQDWIVSTVTTTLAANVENLELVGGALNGRGNTLDNWILGNTLANRLEGGDGNDQIAGNGGNDTLVGGNGADYLAGGGGKANLLLGGAGDDSLSGWGGESVMRGGTGNDEYYVDSAGDRVFELAGQGIDWISSTFSFDLSVGGVNVERLTVNNDMTGIGNALDNVIEGNNGKETLDGRAGNDALRGYQDNDTLTGGVGNDRLDGGTGDDFLTGGNGNDVYFIDSTMDQVKELAGDGIDEVRSSGTVDLYNTGYYTGGGKLQQLAIADVENVTLLGSGNSNAHGNGLNNVLKGNAGNNILNGMEGSDTLIAGNGVDTLNGGIGKDTMAGGKGNDLYYVDNAKDVVVEAAGFDFDQVRSSISYALGANVEGLILGDANINGTGNGLDNRIDGGAGNNKLTGGAGKDTMDGGAGNDRLMGGTGNDALYGIAGDDTLEGGAGDDFLQGRDGNDLMKGGIGDDFYFVWDADDKVVELAGQGKDIIQSEIDFDLSVNGANIETLYVSGGGNHFGIGNALDNYLQGSGGDNLLDGRTGNDTIYGGAGNDTLLGGNGNDHLHGESGTNTLNGGKGNDFYYLDGGGTNTIMDSAGVDTAVNDITTNLGAPSFENIENLTLTGKGLIEGYGNALNNLIKGNSANNYLSGVAGNDTLFGGRGDDSLLGAEGNDSLVGGRGNDLYGVEQVGDKISENANEGFDTVRTTLLNYTLGANIEEVFFDSSSAAIGAGNSLSNRIWGNTANDRLDGKGGDDRVNGRAGDDTLIGGEGNDTLDGGTGIDRMAAGKGNDVYYVDNVADRVIELAGQGYDSIYSEISFDLDGFKNLKAANVEALVLLGIGDINGTGNQVANYIQGNDGKNNLIGLGGNDDLRGAGGYDILEGGTGNDYLDGGAGDDVLVGGKGNDIYVFNSSLDFAVEDPNAGIDEIRSAVSWFLSSTPEVENLRLIGNNNSFGYGNNLANIIVGNSGSNVLYGAVGNDVLFGGAGNDLLEGGAGIDKLTGGKGNDLYILESAKDIVIENANGGTDQVIVETSYTLGANVEELTIGTALDGVNGTGNALDNVIFGHDGKNRLDGRAGDDSLSGGDGNDLLLGNDGDDILNGDDHDDVMRGGMGNDIYYVNSAGDKVTELAGQGQDRIMSLISFDLALGGANVEDLILSDGLDSNGFGNNLGNFIFGNNGKNLLDGRSGNDVLIDLAGQNTLIGGAGNDSLTGGSNEDTLNGGAGNDTLDGGAGNNVLTGGKGNDTYVLSEGFAMLTEEANEGIDLVRSRFNHTLGANFENLTLTGKDSISGTGNTLANIITGNNAGNTLYGDNGNDTLIGKGGQDVLNGGAGKDTMRGGTDSDLYYIDSVADKVIESLNEGFDVILTTLSSYALGANVEALDFTGPGNATGIGNALANEMVGDIGNDKLDGRGGSDTLAGGDGNDRLIGGLGNDILAGQDGNDTLIGGDGNDGLLGDFGKDVMIGGAGDDWYTVYETDDVVQEAANGGTDLVYTAVNMTLGANIENAELLQSNLTVTGNGLNNRILGSGGSDTIAGGNGADVLLGRSGNDKISGGGGTDVIEGGLGADTIDGGAGNDVFRYRLGDPGDLNNLGGDLITGFQHGKDKIDLYDLFSDFDIRTEDVVGEGYLQLFVFGNDTLVLFDNDGGGDTFVTLATLQNVTNATLTDLIYQQGPIVD